MITRNVRNVVIVLVIAALVWLVPGGGSGANTALQALYLGFLGATAWIGYVLYRQHHSELEMLDGRRRALFYAALGLGVLDLAAGTRLRATGGGTVVWIALLAVAGGMLFTVWQSVRRY